MKNLLLVIITFSIFGCKEDKSSILFNQLMQSNTTNLERLNNYLYVDFYENIHQHVTNKNLQNWEVKKLDTIFSEYQLIKGEILKNSFNLKLIKNKVTDFENKIQEILINNGIPILNETTLTQNLQDKNVDQLLIYKNRIEKNFNNYLKFKKSDVFRCFTHNDFFTETSFEDNKPIITLYSSNNYFSPTIHSVELERKKQKFNLRYKNAIAEIIIDSLPNSNKKFYGYITTEVGNKKIDVLYSIPKMKN